MKPEERKEMFARAWKEVFQTEDVKDEDNFFDAAGDSIKAVQLAAWLAQKGVKLDLMNVFTVQTFGEIAETLTDMDPVYVPEKILTKEMAEKEMGGQRPPLESPQGMPSYRPPVGKRLVGKRPVGKPPVGKRPIGKPPVGKPPVKPQGMHRPESHKPLDPRAQQLCDPNDPRVQQLCDPNDPRTQQLCDPRTQQLCDPNDPRVQQLCDPNDPRKQQLRNPKNPHFKRPPVSMRQPSIPMMPAYGYMLVPVYFGYPMMAPQAAAPMMPQLPHYPMTGQRPHHPMMQPQLPIGQGFPPQFDKYLSRPVDEPIENPNVIQIEKPKIAKAEKSAEEVLDYVLNGILPGFSRELNLFEQGLTSLDVMKIVTRCGEYGYQVDMADIFLTPTFDEIVSKMN